MNNVSVVCPYCRIPLSISGDGREQKQLSLRCKFCFGIFYFLPYDSRITPIKNRNHYDIFGLEKNADSAAIKDRYRNLALKFHPDRHSDKDFANEKMKYINYIYSVLSNADLREEYDSSLGFEKEFEDIYSKYEPPHYIYQETIEVVDAVGLRVVIKRGDYIYFPVEQYLSMFGKRIKLNGKGYQGAKIQKIFNPKYSDDFEKLLRRKLDREPLFCINFGIDELIIFKEDFEKIWISQQSLNRRDIKTVIISAVVIISLIVIGLSYLYRTYTWDVNAKGSYEVISKSE